MRFENLITSKLIDINLKVANKNRAIENLTSLMEKSGVVSSASDFIEDVCEREALTTTAVGFGVAIPHARSSSVIKPAVAIGRSVGFSWDQELDTSIKLVFLVAVPSIIESPEYMGILASIARMLVHEEFRKSLIDAKDKDEFISIISNGKKYLVNQ